MKDYRVFANLVIGLAGCMIMLSGCAARQSETATYQNPLGVPTADPSIILHNDVYYLYGTTDPDRGFGCWSSDDLINWEFSGFAFENDDAMWPQTNMWAPVVVEHRNNFYMFFSASPEVHEGKDFRICVAKSPNPEGPFELVKTKLGDGLHDPSFGMIDGHVFFDDDGRIYLYHSVCRTDASSEIWVVELADDLLSTRGQAVKCTRPEQDWENTRIDQDGVGYLWNEGPAVIKHNDTYYLLFSANAFFSRYYGIGYATADNPLGPWEKHPSNPVLSYTDEVSGPGHCCLIRTRNGELFVAYHRHISLEGGAAREVAIDRVHFEPADGGGPDILTIHGPTTTSQPMPR